jgi:hypothetical protein
MDRKEDLEGERGGRGDRKKKTLSNGSRCRLAAKRRALIQHCTMKKELGFRYQLSGWDLETGMTLRRGDE